MSHHKKDKKLNIPKQYPAHAQLEKSLKSRILILDGAMGTMIQK